MQQNLQISFDFIFSIENKMSNAGNLVDIHKEMTRLHEENNQQKERISWHLDEVSRLRKENCETLTKLIKCAMAYRRVFSNSTDADINAAISLVSLSAQIRNEMMVATGTEVFTSDDPGNV